MSNLTEMKCTKHNLLFGFDRGRVRELGVEPALMNCPMCARETISRLTDEADALRGHRDLLLQAIDLKALLVPASAT